MQSCCQYSVWIHYIPYILFSRNAVYPIIPHFILKNLIPPSKEKCFAIVFTNSILLHSGYFSNLSISFWMLMLFCSSPPLPTQLGIICKFLYMYSLFHHLNQGFQMRCLWIRTGFWNWEAAGLLQGPGNSGAEWAGIGPTAGMEPCLEIHDSSGSKWWLH